MTNTDTNVASRTAANESGFYAFPGTIPGPYILVVEAPGMLKFEGSLRVQVQQSAAVDVTLKVGQTTTEVSVRDVTPLVQSDNPTLGHVLERTRIEQLPINGRDVISLLATIPGMESTRAYGLRDGSHELVLDGSALSDRLYGGTVNRRPGLDTIQEFRVENNLSSARYTRPTTMVMSTRSGTNQLHGAAFETNRNNGVVLARRRQDTFTKAPFLNRNEFGASGGGPVYLPKLYNGKDRTFWFFAFEGLRNITPSTQEWYVPTPAMRNGDMRDLVDDQGRQFLIYNPWTTDPNTWARQQFAYNGTPNVIDPRYLSPLAKNLFDITPQPTRPAQNPMLDFNWQGPVPGWQRNWTTSVRIDHRFSDRDQFYGRYTQGNYRNLSQFYSQPMLNNVAGTTQTLAPNKSLALSWVRTVSPTFFNELLVSGARQFWWKGTGDPTVKYADQLGLPNPLNVTGWPGLYDAGLNDNYYFETDNTQAGVNTYAILDDNATKIHGRHEFQFGFHFRYDQLNLLPDQQQNQGNHSWATCATCLYDVNSEPGSPLSVDFTGDNLANMYLGVMNYSNQFVRGYFYARAKEYAGYFQDNFRVSPKLTLNLGLRYEYWPAMTEKNRMLTGFDRANRAIVLGQDLPTLYKLGATVPSIVNRLNSLGARLETWREAGLPQSLMTSPKGDFGPRLGFAYRLRDGVRSPVVRGGYRVSYFHIPARPWVARMRSNAPLNARFRASVTDASLTPDGVADYAMRSSPSIIAGLNSRNAVSLDSVSGLNRGAFGASYFAQNQPDARVQDWNLTFEKEVMENTVVRAGYIGNHSSHLEQFYQYNSATPEYVWLVTTGQRVPSGEYAAVARNPYDNQVYGSIEEYRMSGWGNYSAAQFEIERRYSKGYAFQVFYVVGNNLAAGGQSWSGTSVIPEVNQFLPGQVPADLNQRNAFLNYQRDTSVPKHRVRWNWMVDLPFGKGKPLLGNAGRVLDRLVGGWQVAGMGSLGSTYFSLPTNIFPTGEKIELYGYKYPVQDCTSGTCYPGYLWWNGYIPANRINSVDASGKPNGIMGVPADYKPAGVPVNPWPAATPPASDPMRSYYGGNTTWVPMKDGGAPQRTTYDPRLHPWRQQYFPSVRQWGLDASVFKTVAVRERLHVRLNADFFNVLNHPGNPNSVSSNGVLSVRNSGTHSAAPNARVAQLTLRVLW